jgi:hypothetical protein
MTKAVAIQSYVIIERIVENQAQTTKVHEHELQLFETKITSFHREFLIRSVYDMSFRIISGDEGFLYFHTDEGVYSFMVRNNPKSFIMLYKNLKQLGSERT